MSLLKEYYTLNNGVKIPKIGYGTWQIPNEQAYQTTLDALEVGYRHIDTAKAYGNESAVGQAIKDSGIDRKEIFVTTKLRAPAKGYQETLDAFNAQLKELGLDYIDLYIIHAPWPWSDRGNSVTKANQQAYLAMEELVKQNKVKAIGVSNFNVFDLQAILEVCTITPAVNQIRYSIGHTQDKIVEFCKKHDILIEAYSPLGTGNAFNNPELKKIAEREGVSVAQLCIAYTLEKNTLPLPKTTSKERMIENSQVDFTLSKDVIEELDNFQDIRNS